MLRVTRMESAKETTLKLEGKLAGPWVDEVKECWKKLVEQKTPVDIDLEGLSFVDAAGISLLRDVEQHGTQLLGGSAFIRCLLYPQRYRQTRRRQPTTVKEN